LAPLLSSDDFAGLAVQWDGLFQKARRSFIAHGR